MEEDERSETCTDGSDTSEGSSDSETEVNVSKGKYNVVWSKSNTNVLSNKENEHGSKVVQQEAMKNAAALSVKALTICHPEGRNFLNRAYSELLPMCYYKPLTEIIDKSHNLQNSATSNASDHTPEDIDLDLHMSTSRSGVFMDSDDDSWGLSPIRPGGTPVVSKVLKQILVYFNDMISNTYTIKFE